MDRSTRRALLIPLLAFVLAACGRPSGPVVAPATATPLPTAAFTPTPLTPGQGAPRGTPSPLAAVPSGSQLVLAEDLAWAEVARRVSTAAWIVRPTTLPASLDRSQVTVHFAQGHPQPGYAVSYRGTASDATVTFLLGVVDPSWQGESAVSVRVRGYAGSVSWPATSGPPAYRRVTWNEAQHVFTIYSTSVSGDDLLATAWATVSSFPLPARFPFTRTVEGVCSTPAMSPEQVLRKLFELTGQGNEGGVLDCFATEYVQLTMTGGPGAPSRSSLAAWATLPRATVHAISARGRFGDRPVLLATWDFSADPGGAWSQRDNTRFFTIGRDGGRYRIFEVNSAPVALP